MDIISRLKLFLEQNGISNSQFADTCVIPRPTLSQLLNGRNKKVSDEVISKIHAAYPALNILWLMFGDGEMFVSGAASSSGNGATNYLSKTPQSGNLFMGVDSAQNISVGSSRQPSTISFDDDNTGHNGGAMALSNALQSIARSNGSSPAPSSHGRRIVNIMIFYDDNSFEQIVPR
ncbi:MAG: helix-turn-helix transcriptional regulator [Muribaculaceae bacterium]|nr:helix-turn-helix transcriptional regulator [Muribaculaceae bacterium]